MVSIVMSVVFFGEKPTTLQTIGFLLAVAAILLMNYRKEKSESDFKVGLLLVLLGGGASDAMAKVFEELGTAISGTPIPVLHILGGPGAVYAAYALQKTVDGQVGDPVRIWQPDLPKYIIRPMNLTMLRKLHSF